MNLKSDKNTYSLFWGVLPIIILFAIYAHYRDSTISINIHDTYLIINLFHLEILAFISFLLTGIIYFILEKRKRKLLKILIYTHFILSISSYLIPHYNSFFTKNSNLIAGVSLLLIVIALLLLFTNMIIGIFCKESIN